MLARRLALAIAAAAVLAGCYETPSDVAAVSDATRLTQSPIAAGAYCEASASFDGDGMLKTPQLGDCLTARFAANDLVVAAPQGDEPQQDA